MNLRPKDKPSEDPAKKNFTLKKRDGIAEEYDRSLSEIRAKDAYKPEGFPIEDFLKEFDPDSLFRIEVGFLHVTDLALTIHAPSYQGVSAEEMVFMLEDPEVKQVKGARKSALSKLKYAGGSIVKKYLTGA